MNLTELDTNTVDLVRIYHCPLQEEGHLPRKHHPIHQRMLESHEARFGRPGIVDDGGFDERCGRRPAETLSVLHGISTCEGRVPSGFVHLGEVEAGQNSWSEDAEHLSDKQEKPELVSHKFDGVAKSTHEQQGRRYKL